MPDPITKAAPRTGASNCRCLWLLWLSLALILVGGYGAHLVQTDFGRIDVMVLNPGTRDLGQGHAASARAVGEALIAAIESNSTQQP